MASGDAYNVSDSHAHSDEVAATELNAGFARGGSSPASTTSAARIPTVRYGAFISYSYAASAEVARGLQKWLQTYAKPRWRWRAVNVFRERMEAMARRQEPPAALGAITSHLWSIRSCLRPSPDRSHQCRNLLTKVAPSAQNCGRTEK
jgi:hypothetical protein